jgi:hypothetical protein
MIGKQTISRTGDSFICSALCIGGSYVATLCKGSFIIGSQTMFFSMRSAVGPLVGFYGGWRASIGAMILSGTLSCLFGYTSFFPFLLHSHIATFCASLYWSMPSRGSRMLIPFICIILFIMHPTGGAAWFYALYWLIPIVIAGINPRKFFFHALASTFTAHAVGSVIWLYHYPPRVENFVYLMPLVIIERMLFASTMVLICALVREMRKAKRYMQDTAKASAERVTV